MFLLNIFETNLFGWGDSNQTYGDRITSFFIDEPIVGLIWLDSFFDIWAPLRKYNKKTPHIYFFLLLFL